MAASRTSVRGRDMSRSAMFSRRYVFRSTAGRTNRRRVRSFFRLLRTSWTTSSREPRADPLAYPRTLPSSFSAIRWMPSPSVSPALSSKDTSFLRRPTVPRYSDLIASQYDNSSTNQARRLPTVSLNELLSRRGIHEKSPGTSLAALPPEEQFGPQTQGEGQAMSDNLEVDRPGRTSREESVRDVMTPLPRVVDTSASVMDAAEIMRDANIGDVVVLDSGVLYGILTDRDIVVRVLAEG